MKQAFPFAVYSSAGYDCQDQGPQSSEPDPSPRPIWRGRGAAQAAREARRAVELYGGVAVVLGPGLYRQDITPASLAPLGS